MTPRLSDKAAKQVIVRMTPEMHQAIKDRAALDDRSMAQAVRHAVRLYLASHQESQP